jgi:hypothetical protein
VDSEITLIFDVNLFEWQHTRVYLSLHPFDIVPYEQWLAFVRPDALIFGDYSQWAFTQDPDYLQLLREGFDVWMGGTYSVEFLKVSMRVE